ncbi:MAG: hypothetical protein JO308_16860 [Verrucomicrobia bacterium]|nr:hypothetical protein [Verrucomicrobiota bacterium]
MLLGPHRLIPEDDLIEERNGDTLLTEALQALNVFAFVDVLENPLLTLNLQNWLGQSFVYDVLNETKSTPKAVRSVLHEELTAECFELLERRTRPDAQLWFAIARDRLPESKLMSIYARTLLFNAARGAALLASQAAEHSLTSNVL